MAQDLGAAACVGPAADIDAVLLQGMLGVHPDGASQLQVFWPVDWAPNVRCALAQGGEAVDLTGAIGRGVVAHAVRVLGGYHSHAVAQDCRVMRASSPLTAR